jgi:type VI secretion system protein ImpK
MRLVDYFLKLFAFVYSFQESKAGEYESFRAEVGRLVVEARTAARNDGIADGDFEAGLFAVIAWLDETVMSWEWPGAAQWQKAPLQLQYFQTTKAGVEFFSRLEALGPKQSRVREVYYLALVSGFRGKYLQPDEQRAITWLEEQQLQSLVEDRERLALDGQRPLFPQAYPMVTLEPPGKTIRGPFSSLPWTLALGPLAVVAVLYATFALILILTNHSILSSVR